MKKSGIEASYPLKIVLVGNKCACKNMKEYKEVYYER